MSLLIEEAALKTCLLKWMMADQIYVLKEMGCICNPPSGLAGHLYPFLFMHHYLWWGQQ